MPDPKLTGECQVYDPSARPECEGLKEFKEWLGRRTILLHRYGDSDLLRSITHDLREAFMAGWSARTLTQTYKRLEELQKGQKGG